MGRAPGGSLGGEIALGVAGGTSGTGLVPTLQERVAGLGSAFPWGSVAMAENVWVPSARPL
jgi:hypothetical protein